MNSPEMKALIEQSKFKNIKGFGNYPKGTLCSSITARRYGTGILRFAGYDLSIAGL
jgi:hypothetical protein